MTVPGYKRGLVKRLLAPSFSATTGITIGGQTFDGSQDGKAVGTEYGEFTVSENGIFEVSVGATSAFLLTLKKRGHEFEDSERFSHSLRVTPKRVKLAFVTKNSSDQ